jgi:hypothetical protein
MRRILSAVSATAAEVAACRVRTVCRSRIVALHDRVVGLRQRPRMSIERGG